MASRGPLLIARRLLSTSNPLKQKRQWGSINPLASSILEGTLPTQKSSSWPFTRSFEPKETATTCVKIILRRPIEISKTDVERLVPKSPSECGITKIAEDRQFVSMRRESNLFVYFRTAEDAAAWKRQASTRRLADEVVNLEYVNPSTIKLQPLIHNRPDCPPEHLVLLTGVNFNIWHSYTLRRLFRRQFEKDLNVLDIKRVWRYECLFKQH